MAFEKGNKQGNRFSSTNQPKKRGGKPSYLKMLCKKLGIKPNAIPDLTNDELNDVLRLALFTTPNAAKKYIKSANDDKKLNGDADFFALNLFACLQKNIAKGNLDIIAWIIERLYGKAVQPIESDVNVVTNHSLDLSNLSTEELLQYKALLDKIEGGAENGQG